MKTIPFEKFPDNARLWLYQTDRELTIDEQNILSKELKHFTEEWAAHGNKLWADGTILNPYFVAFVVDETLTPPSGCSIDASVKFLKNIGSKLSVDFFTRLKICIQKNDRIEQIGFNELHSDKISPDELIYDPLINHLKDLRYNWPIPLNKSNFSSVIE